MDGNYLTVKDVCERLHISKATVHNWIKSGKLTAVRAGKRVLIPREAIEALLISANPTPTMPNPS
jgi:excisionase family DNA binding protein